MTVSPCCLVALVGVMDEFTCFGVVVCSKCGQQVRVGDDEARVNPSNSFQLEKSNAITTDFVAGHPSPLSSPR